jgi:predicted DNA-binding WGR domain protein
LVKSTKATKERAVLLKTAVNMSGQISISTASTDWERSALLHRIDPARNEARFYYVLVGPALLDRHAVIRIWGRICGQERMMVTPCETDGEALILARKLVQLRLKHGYSLVWDEMSGEM